MWEYLMEEQFFFKKHLKCSRKEFRSYPINERKWMAQRFILENERERAAIEKAKNKKAH